MNILTILRKLGIIRIGSVSGTYKSYKDMPDELMYGNVYDKKKDLMSKKDYKKIGKALKGNGKKPSFPLTTILFWVFLVLSVFLCGCLLLINGFKLLSLIALALWIVFFVVYKRFKKGLFSTIGIVGLFTGFLLLTLVFIGMSVPSSSSGSASVQAPTKVLETFFNADMKQGEYRTSGTNADGTPYTEEVGKFWIKGKKFKIEYTTKSNVVRIAIISNGETAYFCSPEPKSTCEPAVSSVDSYLLRFNKPSNTVNALGKDTELNCDKYQYVQKTTSVIEGATNGWYNEDAVYCVNGDTLVYIVDRGGAYVDGKIENLMTVKLLFTSLTYGKDISESMFTLPYPVVMR
jgi:hypothetical protein